MFLQIRRAFAFVLAVRFFVGVVAGVAAIGRLGEAAEDRDRFGEGLRDWRWAQRRSRPLFNSHSTAAKKGIGLFEVKVKRNSLTQYYWWILKFMWKILALICVWLQEEGGAYEQ